MEISGFEVYTIASKIVWKRHENCCFRISWGHFPGCCQKLLKMSVFEPPGAKRARKTGERVLGEGHHAEVTFKLAVVHIHSQIVRGELKLVDKSKKRLPRGMVAKTAKVFGVANLEVNPEMSDAQMWQKAGAVKGGIKKAGAKLDAKQMERAQKKGWFGR